MELYTLNRDYTKQDIIDGFNSFIWTERYYGDSQVELSLPATSEMVMKLPIGSFLGLNESDEIMILETVNIKDNTLKLTGISIATWLNNRFVRTTASHKDRYWYLDSPSAGEALWTIVYNMCCEGSPYLDGTNPTGIANPEQLVVPGLGLADYDTSGDPVKLAVPYGPVYAALQEIAKTYEVGMQIIFDLNDTYPLKFRSYVGLDRTSGQTDNPVIRFSAEMDSLTDIEEIQSIASLKTQVYSFAPGLDPEEGQPDLRTTPGVSTLAGEEYTGFDLRAKLLFADDITTDQVGGSSTTLLDILNNRAHAELKNNKYIKTVDGEIVPDSQFRYGVHYNLGDIIEVEGHTGTIQIAQVTEYIRSQDSNGTKAYPTVTAIE